MKLKFTRPILLLLAAGLTLSLTSCFDSGGGNSGSTQSNTGSSGSTANPPSQSSPGTQPGGSPPGSGSTGTSGNGSSGASGGGTPAPAPFKLLDASMPQGATNVSLKGFSVTFTFSNPVDPSSANLDLNASTSDTVVRLVSANHGNEPIAISISGATMIVSLQDPTASLVPSETYTLSIQPTLKDTYGQSVQSSSDLSLSFSTVAGTPPGAITLSFDEDNTGTGLSLTGVTFSYGTASQVTTDANGNKVVSPSANYNIANNQVVEGTQTSPVMPSGEFSNQRFSFQVFYPFASGQTYYFALKACAAGATAQPNCSDFSPEASTTVP